MSRGKRSKAKRLSIAISKLEQIVNEAEGFVTESPERERRALQRHRELHADGLRTDVLPGLTTTGGSGSRNAAS